MKVCALLESPKKLYLIDQAASKVIATLTTQLEKIAKKFKDKQTASSSKPSAPDTSKFRSTVSGMIQVETNVHVNGGYYGSPRTYKVFLKIGSGVESSVDKEANDQILKAIQKLVDENDGLKIPCSLWCDDMMLYVGEESGSSWGGIGFYTKPYSDYELGMRDKYEKGDL